MERALKAMGEKEKDIAKRFFMLLYMFLTKQYEKIEIVFIRHHTEAKEVTEEEFFKRYDNLIPERVRMMVEKRDQPIFTWQTHYHFNYS